MLVGLPSFYFPFREDGQFGISHSFLTTSNGRQYSPSAVVMFFVLQILGGHIGIPFILLTLYTSKGIRRHPMLVNFLITWVIYSTSFCILLYVGKQFGPEPSTGLCAAQASLIYGTAVLTPMAALSFVLNLWLSLRAVGDNKSITGRSSLRNYILISAPYALFVVSVIFMAAYGATNPELLSRNRYLFYCAINSKLVDVIPGIAAIIMFVIIVFEGLVAAKLYRMHKAFVNMSSNGSPPLHLVVRVGIFSVYSFLVIIACGALWSATGAEFPYIIQASLPTAAFVIFGTQRDLLEVWGVIRIWHFLVGKPKTVHVIQTPHNPSVTVF